ncbi:retron system putative HNH endonuclease [Mitsuaria sp. GD03876]|uniref:retron system putative HNH endonuclease n=1 Tax=Mitsuaria sp. GD03876 TaxID=2975399 RepID=UPI00244C8F96|nr:retron system putative HNH endonuclease [Mitsuaria sp. GD03876]MDH0865487.1 TIGR02646 family protein [Mitsuaria sp. GD03876]
MKRTLRGSEPVGLRRFRDEHPEGTWDAFRDAAAGQENDPYKDCRTELFESQGGLCAYCEIDVRDGNPLTCRVEHFHPKSDITPEKNWALDWLNLLGVCAGGSYRYGAAPHTLEPLHQNLSCDAAKDRRVQRDDRLMQCEGRILRPEQIPADACLLKLQRSTGRLEADVNECMKFEAQIQHEMESLADLVEQTIDILNLNCDRLCQARLMVSRSIEHAKKQQRDQGFTPQQGMANLTDRYLRVRWPAFFTTIRLCMRDAFDARLVRDGYTG